MKITAQQVIDYVRQNYEHLQVPANVSISVKDRQYNGDDIVEISHSNARLTKFGVCGKVYREQFACSIFTFKHGSTKNMPAYDANWIRLLVPYMDTAERQAVDEYITQVLKRVIDLPSANTEPKVKELKQLLEFVRTAKPANVKHK